LKAIGVVSSIIIFNGKMLLESDTSLSLRLTDGQDFLCSANDSTVNFKRWWRVTSGLMRNDATTDIRTWEAARFNVLRNVRLGGFGFSWLKSGGNVNFIGRVKVDNILVWSGEIDTSLCERV